MTRRRSVLCLIITLGCWPLLSYSQWSNDPTVNNPICRATGDQQLPVIVSDGSGGAIIVWRDKRSGGFDIYAQRIDSAGVIQWTPDGVAICTAADDQLSPVMTSDGSGGAIIVWQDKRSGNPDIFAQRISPGGTVQWSANGVAVCTAVNDQNLPKVVGDGGGGAVITWDDGRGADYDIYAQRVNGSGSTMWASDGLAISAASDSQQIPNLVSDGSGGAIIAWQDYRNGSTSDIFAQRVVSSGGVQWTTDGVAICTAAQQQYGANLIADGSGGTFIAWTDWRNGNDEDTYAQRVNASGAAQWTADGVAICAAVENQRSVTLTADGKGGALLTWHDTRTSSRADVYAQRVDGNGSLQWAAGGVAVCTAASYQWYPQIVSDAKYGAIIGWYDQRSGSGDVCAQRVGASGGVQWNSNGVAVCSASGSQGLSMMVSDGRGGAIAAWDDARSGGYDIYVSKIYPDDNPPAKHAVGDFDGDGIKDVAVDFGANGAWIWGSGSWSLLTASDPESMLAANIDGNADNEILINLGTSGLWLWDGGPSTLLSGVNPESVAAGDIDADGSDELVADFGPTGLWLWTGGLWTQLSGADVDRVAVANLTGAGGAGIIGDFGTLGLWYWQSGVWTQLSGVNSDYLAAGNTDLLPGRDLIGDFGLVGLWLYAGSSWTQLSGVNADYCLTADVDGNADDEIVGDFGSPGLWIWDSGAWAQLSGVNASFMASADTDGDGAAELAADFGTLGLWLWNDGVWTQLSGVNPENLVAGNLDGDSAAEILADFGQLGLWLWDSGSWSQISSLNPD